MRTVDARSDLATAIQGYFSEACGNVALVAWDDDARPAPAVHPLEALPEPVLAERRREFAIGRACARLALDEAGCGQPIVPRGPDRSPLWPAGYVGSITHTANYAAAAAAKSSRCQTIGIDAEVRGAVDNSLWPILFTQNEIDRLRAHEDSETAASISFSAKEAYFKAFYPLRRAWLDFDAVEIVLRDTRWHAYPRDIAARCGWPPATGFAAISDDLVVTALSVPA